jgi:hypothetical protein
VNCDKIAVVQWQWPAITKNVSVKALWSSYEIDYIPLVSLVAIIIYICNNLQRLFGVIPLIPAAFCTIIQLQLLSLLFYHYSVFLSS